MGDERFYITPPIYFSVRKNGHRMWDALTISYTIPPALFVLGSEDPEILKANVGVGVGYTYRFKELGPRLGISVFGMITNLGATDEDEKQGLVRGAPGVMVLGEVYLRQQGLAKYVPLQLGYLAHFGKDKDDGDGGKIGSHTRHFFVVGVGLSLTAGG